MLSMDAEININKYKYVNINIYVYIYTFPHRFEEEFYDFFLMIKRQWVKKRK